jgi:GNAT superfamily N-acetyltransferase
MAAADSLSLRAATAEDEPFLRALYRASRQAELAGAGWSDASIAAFADSQYALRAAAYRSTFPGADHFVLEHAGTPAGSLIAWRSAACVVLVDLAVAPASRGKGLGGAALARLQHEAARDGLAIALQVEKASRAVALYRRHGFAVIGEDDLHYSMSWQPGAPR